MNRLSSIALALILTAGPAGAQDEMWRWVEDDGTPHYTNDKASIPARYKAKATRTSGEEIGVVNVKEGSGDSPGGGERGGSLSGSVDSIIRDRSPSAVIDQSDAERDDKANAALKYPNDVRQVLVFGAPWCQPCLMLKKQRVLEQLVEAHPELKLKEIDADQKPDVAKKYGVTVLPTVVFTDQDGKELARVRGPRSLAQFERALLVARGDPQKSEGPASKRQ